MLEQVLVTLASLCSNIYIYIDAAKINELQYWLLFGKN